MPAVRDDYRIAVEFADEGNILHFGRSLRERQFEKELREQLGDAVIVTRDGPHVFLYASTPEQAEAAQKAAQEVLGKQRIDAEVSSVLRWHPIEDRWEDASVALPHTPEQIAAEEERDEGQEVEEARERGYAEWEVRVDLPTHRDAVELAKQLDGEGISPIVRRWKYLLIGTATEEDAGELAERIRAETPEGASVKVEPTSAIGWEATGQNPFSAFGGFGPGPR
jgi:hypothetical protein